MGSSVLAGRRAALPLLLALAMLLAGCTDDHDHGGHAGHEKDGTADRGDSPHISHENPYADFEEAMLAEGVATDVTRGDQTWRIKMTEPHDGVHTGVHRFVFVVDDGNGTPVEGALLGLEANMPAMGHGACTDKEIEEGTCQEKDPVEVAPGIYIGQSDLFMRGQWRIDLALYPHPDDAQPALGGIPLRVA